MYIYRCNKNINCLTNSLVSEASKHIALEFNTKIAWYPPAAQVHLLFDLLCTKRANFFYTFYVHVQTGEVSILCLSYENLDFGDSVSYIQAKPLTFMWMNLELVMWQWITNHILFIPNLLGVI